MAPAHTLDKTTLKALINNNINVVTDGFCLFPYYHEEILFVPQLLSTPRKMPFGVYTWCLHPNSMTEESMIKIEKFIKDNKENIISFKDAKKYTTNSSFNKFTGSINKGLLKILRSFRNK